MSLGVGLQWPAGAPAHGWPVTRSQPGQLSRRGSRRKHISGGGGCTPGQASICRAQPQVPGSQMQLVGAQHPFIPSFLLALARPAVGTATLTLAWGGSRLGRRHSTANAGHQGTRALTSALNKPKMEISAPMVLPGLDGAWEAGAPRGDQLGRASHGVSLHPGRGLAAFVAPSEEARGTTDSLRDRPGVGGRLSTRAEPLGQHPGLRS